MSLVRRLFPEPDQREASFLGDLFRRDAERLHVFWHTGQKKVARCCCRIAN